MDKKKSKLKKKTPINRTRRKFRTTITSFYNRGRKYLSNTQNLKAIKGEIYIYLTTETFKPLM